MPFDFNMVYLWRDAHHPRDIVMGVRPRAAWVPGKPDQPATRYEFLTASMDTQNWHVITGEIIYDTPEQIRVRDQWVEDDDVEDPVVHIFEPLTVEAWRKLGLDPEGSLANVSDDDTLRNAYFHAFVHDWWVADLPPLKRQEQPVAAAVSPK